MSSIKIITDLIEIFKELKIPFVYKNTNEKLKIPFVIYSRDSTDYLFADNKNFIVNDNFKLEFYFSNLKKQLELEEEFIKKLEEKRYTFSKSEDIEISKDVYLVYFYVGGIYGR